ncbi:hypothetical protein [Planktomarina sp.]|uniref:hypothetical protein n=1 Tax=Planktomarina sp. TaxID=2024851 RepID=UPI003C54993F
MGAWITEKLDLDGEVVPVPLVLFRCTLEKDITLFDCTLPGLYLTGSQLPALQAQRLLCRGELALRDGFCAMDKVDLGGAKITGRLDCFGGKFSGEDVALDCRAIRVGESVFLRDGYEAQGTINLIRADISGNLDLRGATLRKDFIAQGMRVGIWFIWRGLNAPGSKVDLFDAHVGTLMDQPGSWQHVKHLVLSSFRYDRIESEMDVAERLEWLAKHDNTLSRFTPQPYVQLANVLRQNGFAAEAAQVLIRREDKQRAAEWDRAMGKVGVSLKQELIAFAHLLRPLLSLPFKWIFGYGHQPARALLWVAGLVAITIWFSHETYIRGQFAPTSAVVLTSKEWLDSFPDAALPADSPLWKLQLEDWARSPPGRDYETFRAWLYALDVFIPLDALGQEKTWAPSASRGWWGELGHRLRWLVQMSGWVITAIGAAVVTGLIGRRD